MLLLHHALVAPMDFRDRRREKREAETLGISLAVRFKIGEPGGTCTDCSVTMVTLRKQW